MNFTTQAAEDILSKIERDPAEVRHWRQLLILCFDQKSIETLQTLQVIVAAIDQIWNQRRQKAKDAYEEALRKQRSTGSKEPLPSTTVNSIPLTVRQKETFIKLAKTPQTPALLYRFGLYLEEDFDLPQSARAIYERAMAIGSDDALVEQKITDGLKRLNSLNRETAPQNAPAPADLGVVIAPETMGVKSPSHHRPSAAALIKRSGRLSVDRGRIKASTTSSINANWPDIQKKLDDKMAQLLTEAAAVCETAPRPMRLPRSIAPSQWLEFLESHLTLFLATLEAQGITVRTSVNLEDAPRNDISERTRLVTSMMDEISESMASVTPAPKAPSVKLPVHPSPARLEDIFESIEAGNLDEAESYLREINGDRLFPRSRSARSGLTSGSLSRTTTKASGQCSPTSARANSIRTISRLGLMAA